MRISNDQALAMGLIRDARGNWIQPKIQRGDKPITTTEVENIESSFQKKIVDWLTERGWQFVRSRMDRPTTTEIGVPDFIIAAPGGITFWVECKARTNKPSNAQRGWAKQLQMLGHKHAFVWNMTDFLTAVGSIGLNENPSDSNNGHSNDCPECNLSD